MVSAATTGLGFAWMAALAVSIWGAVEGRERHGYVVGFLLLLGGQLVGATVGVVVSLVGFAIAVGSIAPMLTD